MKQLILLAIVCAMANALSKQFLSEMIEKATKVAANCIDEVHASASDLAELMSFKLPPSTHEGKCTLLCFYKAFHMVDDTGSLNKDGFLGAMSALKAEDVDLYDKIVDIVYDCGNQAEIFDDPCETASGLGTCVTKKSTDMHLEKGLFN